VGKDKETARNREQLSLVFLSLTKFKKKTDKKREVNYLREKSLPKKERFFSSP